MQQDDSDISSSYTPMPTRTKSGRNVNKPVSFVPTLPEPSQGVKRRKSAKAILAAQCTVCHRGSDPSNNRIVFCDSCSNPYHQYCHEPPIDNEVVDVLEKEWLCGPCHRSRQNVVEGTEGLTPGTSLSIDEVCSNGFHLHHRLTRTRNEPICPHSLKTASSPSSYTPQSGTRSSPSSHPTSKN